MFCLCVSGEQTRREWRVWRLNEDPRNTPSEFFSFGVRTVMKIPSLFGSPFPPRRRLDVSSLARSRPGRQSTPVGGVWGLEDTPGLGSVTLVQKEFLLEFDFFREEPTYIQLSQFCLVCVKTPHTRSEISVGRALF